MSQDRQQLAAWLVEELAGHLASVLELMADARPEIKVQALEAPPVARELTWAQSFPPLPGKLQVICTEADGQAVGNQVLTAAGVEDAEAGDRKSTFHETLGQGLSSLAQSLTGRLQKEVTCANGGETTDTLGEAVWGSLALTFGEQTVTLVIGAENVLLGGILEQTPSEEPEAQPEPVSAAEPAAQAMAVAAASSGAVTESAGSKTFDLLLDVEMPVSVSFGRAQVALRDVLKLTTGSIVELDRAIAEPVDVVVNNCVIARGEVVVVEGNFGVRIEQVISRGERLRSIR